MTIKKIPNPEYTDLKKALALQKANVDKAKSKYSNLCKSALKLCKESEKAEQALRKIIEDLSIISSDRNDAFSLLSETRDTLAELTTHLKETPEYIQGNN